MYTRLTRLDLKAFDKRAADLVLETMEYGWLGRVSSKGHAILRAPDGQTTMSVARDSDRSTGANARADFDRWLRTAEPQTQETLSNETGSAEPTSPPEQPSQAVLGPSLQGQQGSTDEKRVCSECGREFETYHGLNAHGAAHRTEKHPCPRCGKRFKHLGKHLRTHVQSEEKVDPLQLIREVQKRMAKELEQMEAAIELVVLAHERQQQQAGDLEALRDLVRESGLFH